MATNQIARLIAERRWEEALKAIRSSRADGTPAAEGWWMETHALLELGRFHEALSAAEKGMEIAPSEGESHFWLGIAQARTGRTDQAEQTLRSLVEAEPANARAWAWLATLQELKGDLAGAAESRGHAEGRSEPFEMEPADSDRTLEVEECLKLLDQNSGDDTAAQRLRLARRKTVPAYRLLTVFELWMHRFGLHWWLPFLFAFVVRAGFSTVTKRVPVDRQWIVWTCVGAVAMVLWGWVLVQPLATLVLRMHTIGRRSLRHADHVQLRYLAVIVGTAIAAGLGNAFTDATQGVVAACAVAWALQGLAGAVSSDTAKQLRWQRLAGNLGILFILVAVLTIPSRL